MFLVWLISTLYRHTTGLGRPRIFPRGRSAVFYSHVPPLREKKGSGLDRTGLAELSLIDARGFALHRIWSGPFIRADWRGG